jgi:hypothetical protein
MAAFGFGPGQPPPPEVPPARTPAPDPGGLLDRLLKPLLDWIRSPEFATWWRDLAISAAGAILAALIKMTNAIALFWVETFDKAEAEVKGRREATAAAAIKALFDVDVPVGRGAGAGASRAVGAAILRAITGSTVAGGGGPLRPSKDAAEHYMTLAAKLAIDGWMEGFAMELTSLGSLETFADLDDNLASMLGIGRMAQQVARPALDITVLTPFEWLLNKTYRPRLLTARQVMRMVQRGRWSRPQAQEELARQGYSDEKIEALLAQEERRMSSGDLDYLVARGAITREAAEAELVEAGWTRASARVLLSLEADRRLDPFRRRAAEAAMDAYVSRDIDRPQYQRILQTTGITPREQEMYDLLGGLRRELRTKELSESELEQAVKVGLRTLQDYRVRLLRDGYSLADVQVKELLLLGEIREAEAGKKAREQAAKEREAARRAREEAAEKRREEAAARAAARDLSLSQVEGLVRAGLRSLAEYREFVLAQGFDASEADDLVELLGSRLAARDAAAQRREEARALAAVRRVSLSDIERAVKRGVLTVEEYQSILSDQGFGAEDQEILVRLIQDELREQADAEAAREAARAKLAAREVSLGDLELAVRRGIRTVEDYRARLIGEGFTADAADVLVTLLRGDLAADAAARDRRAQVEAAAKRRKISLADLARGVRAGVRPIADYRRAVADLGFSIEDQDTLEALLKLEMQADADAANRREAAERRLAERRISLSDVEAAVALGIMTPAQYRAVLAREGFPDEDQVVLSELLRVKLAAAAAAKQKREADRQAAPARALKRQDFERAVLAGLRSLDEYAAHLHASGYDAAAVDTLRALLELEVMARRAASQAEAQADATASARGVSLADFRAAVRAGLRGLEDYRGFLRGMGFGLEDVELLVDLLAAELRPARPPAEVEAQADETARARGVSLADFRAAVRVGLRGLEDYAEFLRGMGFGAEDIELLVDLLAEQLQAAGARRAAPGPQGASL